MGFGQYDSAGLAVVGYAQVRADASTPDCNSGLTITKTGTGSYSLQLPPVGSDTQTLQQDNSRILISAIPIDSIPGSLRVINSAPNVRTIVFTDPDGGLADAAFHLIVFRTLVPPPAGSPA